MHLIFQLKSDRFGMEIFSIYSPYILLIPLKSDRFGMEIITLSSSSSSSSLEVKIRPFRYGNFSNVLITFNNVLMLKSDRFGMEISQKTAIVLAFIMLKSDRFGMETIMSYYEDRSTFDC